MNEPFQSISAIKYPECKHIKREQPHLVVSEEQMRAFLLEADVLPLFEERMQDYKRVKHYSLTTNKLLSCHWKAFIKSLDKAAEKTHYSAPSVDDFHFQNYLIKYQPQDKTANHKFTMKCGPGVDEIGQLPIPEKGHNYSKGLSKLKAAAKLRNEQNTLNLAHGHHVAKTELKAKHGAHGLKTNINAKTRGKH